LISIDIHSFPVEIDFDLQSLNSVLDAKQEGIIYRLSHLEILKRWTVPKEFFDQHQEFQGREANCSYHKRA
jgi:hypothetical protein